MPSDSGRLTEGRYRYRPLTFAVRKLAVKGKEDGTRRESAREKIRRSRMRAIARMGEGTRGGVEADNTTVIIEEILD